MAAHLLGVDAAEIELVDGAVRARGAPESGMSLQAAAETAAAGQDVPGPLLEAAFREIVDGKASDTLIARSFHRDRGKVVADPRLPTVATSCPLY